MQFKRDIDYQDIFGKDKVHGIKNYTFDSKA